MQSRISFPSSIPLRNCRFAVLRINYDWNLHDGGDRSPIAVIPVDFGWGEEVGGMGAGRGWAHVLDCLTPWGAEKDLVVSSAGAFSLLPMWQWHVWPFKRRPKVSGGRDNPGSGPKSD